LLEECKEINSILTKGDGKMTEELNALTMEEKNHFDTQGYLIVKNLLSFDEVSELRFIS
jgi:hypothetical protein